MRPRWLLIGALAIVAVIGLAVWLGRDTYQSARLGSVYAAKQTCSCLFIAHRTMESCKTDYDPTAVKPLTWTVADNSVTVSAIGGLVSARADFEEGFGCHPAN